MSAEKGTTIWTNTEDGNNHSLKYYKSTLTLTVIKPDGAKYESEPQPTSSSAQEWLAAFEGVGPKWSQVPGAEDKGNQYLDARARGTPQETALWMVDHTKGDTLYELADRFRVLERNA